MEDQKNTINDDQKTVLKTVLKEVLIDGPKKRGRKPKNQLLSNESNTGSMTNTPL